MLALITVERAVRCTDTIMLSEIMTSAFLISSSRIGSIIVGMLLCQWVPRRHRERARPRHFPPDPRQSITHTRQILIVFPF